MDQHEVSEVDEGTDALPDYEHRILPVNDVRQRNQASDEAQIPKSDGHVAYGVPLRGDPLDHPPHEEEALAEEPDAKPDDFSSGHSSLFGLSRSSGSFRAGFIMPNNETTQTNQMNPVDRYFRYL
jgi:hypothetical protein